MADIPLEYVRRLFGREDEVTAKSEPRPLPALCVPREGSVMPRVRPADAEMRGFVARLFGYDTINGNFGFPVD